MADKQTVWITKYWETKGILRVEAEIKRDHATRGARAYVSFWLVLYMGRDAWTSEEDAQARVRELAQRRLKTLHRKLDKVADVAANGTKVVEK